MRLPTLARLLSEDYQDQSKWIDRLLTPLNQYFGYLTQALTRGLTISDNMVAAIKTVEVDGNWPIKLAWELPARPTTAIVGQIVRSDGVSFSLSAAAQVQWQFNQANQLQIDGITGVTPSASNKYKITLVCFTS